MKNKGFVHVLILILVVLGIGVLGYYSWEKGYIKFSFPTKTTDSASIVTSSPSLYKNWNGIADESVSISFKYPPNWTAVRYEGSTFGVFLEDKPFEIIEGSELMASIMIGLNEATNTLTNEKYFQDKNLDEGVHRYEDLFDKTTLIKTKVSVDGKEAYRLEGKNGPGMLEGEYNLVTLIQLDNKLLVATLTNEKYKEIYNQILSTFKFATVATKLCPQGFELYDGTQFLICYPNGMEKEVTTFNSADIPNRSSVSVSFTNSTELIRVASMFSGGWGGGTCSNETRKINAYSVDILRWDENENPGCDSGFINLVAVIGGNNRTGVLPIAIDYQRTKGSGSLDETIFTTMLNSLVIK